MIAATLLLAAATAASAAAAGVPAASASGATTPAPGAATSSPPPVLCGVCHPDIRVQFEQSVHQHEGIDCTACHGGHAADSTVAGAHRPPFRGRIKKRDVPALCASCHADIAMMKPYDLPADQYALYQTSQHGILLARGDERVAVCTDCHGVHEIRRRTDPKSSVFSRAIPSTCGRCHGAGTDGAAPKAGSPYADYAAGVHGRAFLEQGDAAAPTCASCHGTHGATPPGVGDVDKVCGQCHATAREYYRAGPHARAMRAGHGPECADCHGNHRIGPAGPALLDTVCVTCHDAASDQARVAERMKTLFTGADEEIAHARLILEQAAAIPLYVEDYRARLEEARTSLVEAVPVVHALDVGRVEQYTARTRGIAREVESELDGKLGQRWWRRVGLLLFWVYLLLTLAILVFLRQRAAGRGVP
jgi:predicted CXXCH cytochrome family protein